MAGFREAHAIISKQLSQKMPNSSDDIPELLDMAPYLKAADEFVEFIAKISDIPIEHLRYTIDDDRYPCTEDNPWYCIVELPTGEELARDLFNNNDVTNLCDDCPVISEDSDAICRARNYWQLLQERNMLAEKLARISEAFIFN